MSIATIKLALRVLLRRKAFTAISLFGVTLTLLVLLVATALTDATFAPQAPETNAARSLVLEHVVMAGPQMRAIGPPGLGLIRSATEGLPGDPIVTVFEQGRTEAAWLDGRKIRLSVKRTDADFWKVHEFRFLEGGPYGADDDENGRAVAVISEATRRQCFAGEPALERTLELDGRTYRIAGVVEDVSFLRMYPFAEVWAPLGTLAVPKDPTALMGESIAIVLARDDDHAAALKSEMTSRIAAVQIPDSDYETLTAHVDLQPQAVARHSLPPELAQDDPAGRLRLVLVALAAAFMLLPALNLVNLSLSRVLERAPEIGVRKAFGATRLQIVTQFVAENVLLTMLGGLLAVLVTPFVLAAIDRSGLIPGSDLSINHRVLLKGLLFAIAFGILSGAWPAWRMSRLPPVDVLRGRTT